MRIGGMQASDQLVLKVSQLAGENHAALGTEFSNLSKDRFGMPAAI